MDLELIREQLERGSDARIDAANEALLRERTARLAEAPAEPTRELAHEVVEVARAGGRFGLPRACVKEVRRVRLCRLPHTPPTVPGVFHVRGRVLSALDIQPLLGEAEPPAHGERCLVAMLTSARGQLGLLIDAVHGLRPVYRDELDGGAELGRSEFLIGVTHDLLALVDISRLLERGEFIVGGRHL